MKQQLFLVGLLLGVAIGGGFAALGSGATVAADARPAVVSDTQPAKQPTHPLRFYDQLSFQKGIESVQSNPTVTDYHILGGITPHHLVAGFIFSDFYQRLAVQKPKTIILIGPNHYEHGHFPALTSRLGWETPFGTVTPNLTIIDDLVAHNLAQIDEEAVPNDHSTAGSMSYVKYYVPGATVVPIILSGKMSRDAIEKLSDHLATYLDQSTVLVAPVDFSHYLTSVQAESHDKETLSVMQSFDYSRLLTFGNDNVDSPVSIATLLMTMQKVGATKSQVIYNTNSGILAKDNHMQTTSYFSMLYH